MYAQYTQLNRYRKANGRVRIVKYVRCSSDEQKKNGYTIQDQSNFIDVFAKENDLIVVDEYVDEGISATLEIQKRKALAQLIKDAKAGKFDIVVFKCIDRFFRNTEEFYIAQKELRKAGVTWLSIEEADLDPENDDALFKINIYLAMAEYEARKTGKRIRFNNAMRIKNKQVVTGQQCFMFPWKVVGDKRNRHLERNMDMAERVYELLNYFEVHQSKRATVVYYNMKYGENLTVRTFGNLLQDTLLYGVYKGEEDYVEPYISKERFDHLQEISKRNSRHSTRKPRTFLFSGILKCHICGSTLVGNFHHRGLITPNYSYRCNKYRGNKTCTNSHSTTEHLIETQLLNNLDKYIQNEYARVESLKEAKSNKIDNTKRIAELKSEMNRLNTMYRKGRIEEKDYDEEYEVLERQLKELSKEEPEEEKDLSALKKLMESDYRTMYEALDKEHKKAFWRAIIKEFKLKPDKSIDEDSIIFF